MLPTTLSKKSITEEKARAAGMQPLTLEYNPEEYWMLHRVARDMNRGNIPFAMVIENPLLPNHISIYRRPGNSA